MATFTKSCDTIPQWNVTAFTIRYSHCWNICWFSCYSPHQLCLFTRSNLFISFFNLFFLWKKKSGFSIHNLVFLCVCARFYLHHVCWVCEPSISGIFVCSLDLFLPCIVNKLKDSYVPGIVFISMPRCSACLWPVNVTPLPVKHGRCYKGNYTMATLWVSWSNLKKYYFDAFDLY